MRSNTEAWYDFDFERGTVEVHMKGSVHTIGRAEIVDNRNDRGRSSDTNEQSNNSTSDGERRERR